MVSKRKPLVAGNWKMNFNHREATHFIQKFAWLLRDAHYDYHDCEIALMPSFTSIRSVQVLVESDHLPILYGAQAVSVTAQGAFTGDVSADMLASLGCSMVIVGHSERRKYHPEDDANIVDQVRAVLAAGMQPILCVGESLKERQQGVALDFAVGQVHDVTRDLDAKQAKRLIIAYEPVWAIGTGMVATANSAQEAALAIREDLRVTFGDDVADTVRILYGGSVTSSNASSLIAEPDVDGFLIGGASLDAQELANIVQLTAAQTRLETK
ncbi:MULTISPECIES: triose-phosphate isomerase [Gardnerella]|uniref:Triosephosphate isomerase n=1 Tax=Gardnerella leopoldii TaxID=2792978 RepID=A0ABX4SEQ2_9BIFI|nr:triosephosphate isomerase [Gardnerella vaginalis 6420LIT]EIK79454.1 triosephosphate isomerase [Gardnerella vaginalis 6420B]NSX30984.1 triose-phosphate isomerase [Gardnerella vaginalis]PKZ18494.1 triose-phosphate isomerase [Gardnerella vaginalis]PKZ19645.1 triose-phosphate isomerase [Gardnerella vaginalis]